MSRKIYCVFLKCKSEKQHFQMYPGKLGKRIYENISQEAWKQWQIKQTMLINEKKLTMMNVADRKILEQEMITFLFKGQDIHMQEYTPPS
ncbi:MAG: oxidative damage protection protein [Sodalis sp. (in: enterobacteria)]